MKNVKCFDILTALTKSGKNADAYYWLGVAHLALKNDADQPVKLVAAASAAAAQGSSKSLKSFTGNAQ